MSSLFHVSKNVSKGKFSSPDAERLAERWQSLPIGTLVKNGDGAMVYLGFILNKDDGLPDFWFWSFKAITDYTNDRYKRHMTRYGIASCAWFKPIDVEGWDG